MSRFSGPGPESSRLERMIARLNTQRRLLEWAVREVAAMPGPMIELGLGKGRTYDHLRRLAPDRDILVFDKLLHAPEGSRPPAEMFYLGDFRQTWERAFQAKGASAVLAHADIGSHDAEADRRRATELAPLLDRLLAPGAIVMSDREMSVQRWRRLDLPDGLGDWPYFLYRARS